MSQSIKKTFFTAGAGYVQMFSAVAAGLLTLRLATHHLSPEELGIWNFVFATVSYFALLELGLGPGIARLLGDPLAEGNQKKANELFTTGMVLLAFQGGLFLLLGWVFREALLAWGRVPNDLMQSATLLWTGVLLIRSLTLPIVLFNGILWAQNRVYWIHIASCVLPWTGFAVFAWALQRGDGLLAYLWSLTVPAFLNVLCIVVAVLLGPHAFRPAWRGIHLGIIREILSYSWAVFAASGAAQLSTLSQMVIVTRICGLEAAGIFGVTSRIPTLLVGMISRPFDSFIPRWTANYCEHGVGAVKQEFLTVLRCSLLGTAASAIAICLVNPAFVRIWTRPEFYGGWALNSALAALLLYQMVSRAFAYAFTMRKQMTGFALASLGSVGLEIALQVGGAKLLGISGVILGYLAAVCAFLLWYTLKNGCRMLEVRATDAFLPDFVWWGPSLGIAMFLGALEPGLLGDGSVMGLTVSILLASVLALPIAWRFFSILNSYKSTRSAPVSL